MAKTVIAVSGKDGQLGNELQQLSIHFPQFEFHFAGRAELDLSDNNSIEDFFGRNKFSYFINCAAYTAVDKAETEKEKAMQVNAIAVGQIAALCEAAKTKLIHISTDYVFDGNGSKPYRPQDSTKPVNFYGETKLLGEQLAAEHCKETVIIRTSWVYSSFGNNFVKTMMRLMKEREEINVVNDQLGSPTYAKDLADAIMKMVQKDIFETGIFHFSNDGIISWHQFAEAIKEETGSSCKVNGISTSQYPTPAKRPHYSVMDKSKIMEAYGIDLKGWRRSLKECLAK